MEPEKLREQLATARLYLIFVPGLCGERSEEVLSELLPLVDVVQVRPKPLARVDAVTEARPALEWSKKVLDLCAGLGEDAPLVIVNDRVDVALALRESGIAGVHLGQDDMPPGEARGVLGEELLIGLSTHDAAQVVQAGEEPVDYLGFGPAFPTATKGYEEGQGPERVWVADAAAGVPLFAIGGIDLTNASDLAPVRRVAVGSALLSSDAPARDARQLRVLLEE